MQIEFECSSDVNCYYGLHLLLVYIRDFFHMMTLGGQFQTKTLGADKTSITCMRSRITTGSQTVFFFWSAVLYLTV